MTDQQRPVGYRGALPPREDPISKIWVAAVIAIFLLIFVLSFLGVPSVLFPDETPMPRESVSPSLSPDLSPGASPGASLPEGSISPTGSPAD